MCPRGTHIYKSKLKGENVIELFIIYMLIWLYLTINCYPKWHFQYRAYGRFTIRFRVYQFFSICLFLWSMIGFFGGVWERLLKR